MSFNSVKRFHTGSMKWMKYPKEVLPMWVADMDFASSPAIINALHDRVEHGVFGYTLPTNEIIEVVVNYFKRKYNWEIKPEWLVFSPGLGVAIHTVTRYLGNLAAPVLTPNPIYHVFRTAPPRAKRHSIPINFIRENDTWVLDLAAIKDALFKNPKGCVLMLCNPHNPNGHVYTKAELEEIANLALTHDCLICSDDVHADLILDEDVTYTPMASLAKEVADICLTMQSPSKAYNVAGLNFAVNVIANEEIRKQYEYGAKGQVISQLNPFGYAAAKAAWSEDSSTWLADCILYLRTNRDILAKAVSQIEGMKMPHLASTYLAWINVANLNVPNVHDHFVKHGLGVSAGEEFGDKDYVRLNFACDQETLELGIERLQNAIAALK